MLFSLFLTFFKIGLFTFGGGYAMIAQIRESVVQQKSPLDDDELTEIIAIAESTPGPIAINMATYVGYKNKGVLGSACATLGVVLPSLIIILIISNFLDLFMSNKFVRYAFVGIKCAVAFLILKAGFSMFAKVQKKVLPLTLFASVLALTIAFEIFAISFSSVWFILVGGLTGIFAYAVLGAAKGEKVK